MSKALRLVTFVWIAGAGLAAQLGGCSSNGGSGVAPLTDGSTDSSTGSDGSGKPAEGGTSADGGDGSAQYTYVLIDDMETTTNGPIELTGITPPLTPAYWFNVLNSNLLPPGASCSPTNCGGNTADPPYTSFAFSAVSPATTTLNGKVSMHAAHQVCSLNGLYDVCGLGFEFAQEPAADAGTGTADAGEGSTADTGASDAHAGDAGLGEASTADTGASDAHAGDATSEAAAPTEAGADAGDGAAPIPRVTVPFDISQYKGIVFWGKAGNDAGTLDVKVQFPDVDTDPRGGMCNGAAAGAAGPNDLSLCYNSYALHETFTGAWQEFTILFSDLAIANNFGWQAPGPWAQTKVYGINWQGQNNNSVDAGATDIDFWVDDVYFIK